MRKVALTIFITFILISCTKEGVSNKVSNDNLNEKGGSKPSEINFNIPKYLLGSWVSDGKYCSKKEIVESDVVDGFEIREKAFIKYNYALKLERFSINTVSNINDIHKLCGQGVEVIELVTLNTTSSIVEATVVKTSEGETALLMLNNETLRLYEQVN